MPELMTACQYDSDTTLIVAHRPPARGVPLDVVVGGLTSEEIAAAFLVSVPTVQARITRAKRTRSAAHVPFEVPDP